LQGESDSEGGHNLARGRKVRGRGYAKGCYHVNKKTTTHPMQGKPGSGLVNGAVSSREGASGKLGELVEWEGPEDKAG